MLRGIVGVVVRNVGGGPHRRGERKYDPPSLKVAFAARRSGDRDTVADDEVWDDGDPRQPAQGAPCEWTDATWNCPSPLPDLDRITGDQNPDHGDHECLCAGLDQEGVQVGPPLSNLCQVTPSGSAS